MNTFQIYILRRILLNTGGGGDGFDTGMTPRPGVRGDRDPNSAPTVLKKAERLIIIAILWVSAMNLIISYGLQ